MVRTSGNIVARAAALEAVLWLVLGMVNWCYASGSYNLSQANKTKDKGVMQREADDVHAKDQGMEVTLSPSVR